MTIMNKILVTRDYQYTYLAPPYLSYIITTDLLYNIIFS